MSDHNQRFEGTIARRLSELIPDLQDPRIPLIVTVEKVRLNKDKTQAKVLLSTLKNEDFQPMEQALNGAAGYLQRELGRDLKVRRIPKLIFTTHAGDIL